MQSIASIGNLTDLYEPESKCNVGVKPYFELKLNSSRSAHAAVFVYISSEAGQENISSQVSEYS